MLRAAQHARPPRCRAGRERPRPNARKRAHARPSAALDAWEARKRAQRAAVEARVRAEAERFREATRVRPRARAPPKQLAASAAPSAAGRCACRGRGGGQRAVFKPCAYAPLQRKAAADAVRHDAEFEATLQEVVAGIAGGGGVTAEAQAVRPGGGAALLHCKAGPAGLWQLRPGC